MTTTDAVADPLAVGASALAAAQSTADGGIGGFSNQGSAWDAAVGKGVYLSDLGDLLTELEDSPHLLSAANLRALNRLREELMRTPETAGLTDPIVITVQDAVLIARQLLQRFR